VTSAGPLATRTSLASKLRQRVEALDLDLSGATVLTEAATGPYVVTPVLAALAGARVIAFARNGRFGTSDDAFDATGEAARAVGLADDSLVFVRALTPDVVGEADVITNSGHLRPLDADLLSHARRSAVIPLMYEAWEWRDGDVDLEFARSRGIRVGATNERHPDVDVFGYLGDMALKLIFDAGSTPYRNTFLLVANNSFGPYIARTLARVCAELAVLAPESQLPDYGGVPGVRCLEGFPHLGPPPEPGQWEAVIVALYPFDQSWIGDDAVIATAEVASAIGSARILRFAGDVDVPSLERHGVDYFPPHVTSGHMGVLPSAVGSDPVIRLQAGGLKAAEAMLRGVTRHRGHTIVEEL
jgi:hypothetical protein